MSYIRGVERSSPPSRRTRRSAERGSGRRAAARNVLHRRAGTRCGTEAPRRAVSHQRSSFTPICAIPLDQELDRIRGDCDQVIQGVCSACGDHNATRPSAEDARDDEEGGRFHLGTQDPTLYPSVPALLQLLAHWHALWLV